MRRHAGTIGRAVLVAAILVALVLFARSVSWPDTWRAVRAASPGLLIAAAAVNLASMALKGVRWWLFLRAIGMPSVALAVRGAFVGMAFNNILLANGGEAARVIYVARQAHVPASRIIATMAMERLFEVFSYVALLAVAVSAVPLPAGLGELRGVAVAALVVMVGLLVYLLRHPERAELPLIEGEGLLTRARRFGRTFMQTLRSISSGPRFAAAFGISAVVWALQVWTYHLTASAAGLPISLAATLATVLVVNVGFVVRATPGNVGVFQMMYAVTAVGFGLDRDQATATAFLIQIQQILPVTLLGLAWAPSLLFRRRHSARRTNVLPGEPVPQAGVGSRENQPVG